jgi:predicted PurR-regulated permease PerM
MIGQVRIATFPFSHRLQGVVGWPTWSRKAARRRPRAPERRRVLTVRHARVRLAAPPPPEQHLASHRLRDHRKGRNDVTHRYPILRLTRPLNVRSTSLAALAILSTIYFLRSAQAVFIPVTIAVVTTCALVPSVRWLRRVLHIPQPLGAAAVLLLLCTCLGVGAVSLQPQAIRILDVVPHATAKFSAAMRDIARDHNGALQKFNRAAAELERAASVADASTGASQRAATRPPVAPVEAPIDIRDYIMMGTANAVAGFGQLVVVLSLVYFFLISGDSFRFALVRASGQSIARRKATLRIFDETVAQIQRYLGLQVATSALLGIVVGIACGALGLENAVFWACCGALLHLIPYVGPAVFLIIVSMVAYVQFQTWVPVAGIIISILLATGIIGMLLMPWLTQRLGRLNAIAVFVSLLFWSWMWGTWGLLLGIPVMMAVSVVCKRIEGLQIISEFLSGRPTGSRPGTDHSLTAPRRSGPRYSAQEQ